MGGVKVTLGELCSAKLPPGEDAKKEYSMSLPRLRNAALRFIHEDKFRPEGSEDVDEDSDEVYEEEEPAAPNNQLVARAPGFTVVETNVANGSNNQSNIFGDYSGNTLSNNRDSFNLNENYNAEEIAVFVRLPTSPPLLRRTWMADQPLFTMVEIQHTRRCLHLFPKNFSKEGDGRIHQEPGTHHEETLFPNCQHRTTGL